MDKKILIFGLCDKITKPIALDVADATGKYFMDVSDLISYSLQDEKHIKDVAGVEYYDKEVKKLLLSLCSYENIVVNCPYDLLNNECVFNKLKQNFKFVYINMLKSTLKKINKDLKSSSLDTNLLVYKELNLSCKNKADEVILVKEFDKNLITAQILEKLNN